MRHFHIARNIVFKISPSYYCRTKRKQKNNAAKFFFVQGGLGVVEVVTQGNCILGNVKIVSLTFLS